MPSEFRHMEHRNLSPMIAAWAAHLIRKGCHPTTAQRKAEARVWRKDTWPPAIKAGRDG